VKKQNLTQQKQICTSKPKDTITQNKQRTKARFGRLAQCRAQKQIAPIRTTPGPILYMIITQQLAKHFNK